jgi:hypothetical protein
MPNPSTAFARFAFEAAQNRAAAAQGPNATDFNTAWGVTMPACLEPAPQPFLEPLHGLAMREVDEPELFRHFFG